MVEKARHIVEELGGQIATSADALDARLIFSKSHASGDMSDFILLVGVASTGTPSTRAETGTLSFI